MKVWTEEEEGILKDFYPKFGLEYCLDKINKTKSQVRAKLQRLGLKLNEDEKYKLDNFKNTIENSINLVDACRNLGLSIGYGNRKTIKKYIDKYQIDISHFHIPTVKTYNKLNIDEILVEKSAFKDTTKLKNKLYKIGLKQRGCEICGQDENWRGKKISLILDHINGINDDNRLINLQIVCPNCNASLDTFCRGKNKLSKYYNKMKTTNQQQPQQQITRKD